MTSPRAADATGGSPEDDRSSSQRHTSDARLEAAGALRALGSAFIGHQPDDALLQEIADVASRLRDRVEATAPRQHAFFQPNVSLFDGSVGQGPAAVRRISFPDSVVSGQANPLSFGAALWRDADAANLSVTIGPALEGAPGRAHGGVVAALIDELMGFALSFEGSPAFTGRLTISYRAPTPVGVEVTGRAWISERRPRTLDIAAELHHGETLLAEAEGRFVKVDLSRFLTRSPGVSPTADDPG